MNNYRCRVCGSHIRLVTHIAKEMMYGTREEFQYDECSNCFSLQISVIPDQQTLSRHYSSDYYSFTHGPSAQESAHSWLKSERDKAYFSQNSYIGRVLKVLKPVPLFDTLRASGLKTGQYVLDVGCGAGFLLDNLAQIGFKNLLGIDPFISADMFTSAGVPIKRSTLFEMEDSFDFIMFNHSFEHLPLPRDELMAALKCLHPNGRCLIRVPTPSSRAWETYGVNWVQLDAPRHLTLISRLGMRIMASGCGFQIVGELDDSQAWSLMASELYQRGNPTPRADFEAPFFPRSNCRVHKKSFDRK